MTDENSNKVTVAAASVQKNSSYTDSSNAIQPDLQRLASALSVLDADCDEFTWKFHRIAPLANTAIVFPELANALYDLAKAWSRGDLQAEPSKAWGTPSGNGISGKDIFDNVWDRFYKSNYTGTRATLGTIYFHAKEAGWALPEEHFECIVGEEA